MKTIPIRDKGMFKSKDVFIQAVRSIPQGGDILEIRRRVRVIDAIEKATSSLKLEDTDHKTLKDALEAQPWAIADAELLKILDDVLQA